MTFADATELEGITNNNVDKGLIQMVVKKLVKKTVVTTTKKRKIYEVSCINFILRSNVKQM